MNVSLRIFSSWKLVCLLVSCVAYVAGQFFFLKYVVIFGVPSFFALVDGMQPPGPPICISRVSKYSQMWRYFDQGLYQFLKNQVRHNQVKMRRIGLGQVNTPQTLYHFFQVYIPLMGNTQDQLSLNLRRLGAMVSVFLFVLAWHGLRSNYLYWVMLSALELIIERIGRYISSTKPWVEFSQQIGESNSIRIQSIAMLLTVIPGK